MFSKVKTDKIIVYVFVCVCIYHKFRAVIASVNYL